MNYIYKIYLKYIFLNFNLFFLKQSKSKNVNLNIFIYKKTLYYLIMHLKLSSIFCTTQLLDIFSYELPTNSKAPTTFKLNPTTTKNIFIILYNFYCILHQQRYFIFVIENNLNSLKSFSKILNVNSTTELFLNANWLEREVSEMYGIFFEGKKDLRNLMLQYGDTTTPMLKIFPSIGTRDIYYDALTDFLTQTPVTMQY